MKHTTFALALAALLLSGCAGYNHTLFMTKSNVGLDFDTKPPTAEITVSRKEAVIAPAFEGGQTPPVIASFKPRSEVGGGFQNFFVGVDQAFAGGDAAVSMAKNYSRGDLAPDDPNTYDSTLTLTAPPKYTDPFRRLATNGDTRPFIFGTDTMMGLKVAWSGTGGQFPDSVKAGFNRKEFAWAPLSITNGNKVKMPSFLATIEGRIEAGGTNTGAGIKGLQYFATGRAATALTLQPAVRRAMIERLDPKSGRLNLDLAIGSTFLSGLEAMLHAYAQTGDTVAREHGAALQQLTGVEIPANFQSHRPPLIRYVFSDAAQPLIRVTQEGNYTASLSSAVAYLETLHGSTESIKRALKVLDGGGTVRGKAGSPAGADIAVDANELRVQLAAQTAAAKALTEVLSAQPAILSAYYHVKSKF